MASGNKRKSDFTTALEVQKEKNEKKIKKVPIKGISKPGVIILREGHPAIIALPQPVREIELVHPDSVPGYQGSATEFFQNRTFEDGYGQTPTFR